jgi:hypothetical protein
VRFAAFWNGAVHTPTVRAALRPVYERLAPELWAEPAPRRTITGEQAADPAAERASHDQLAPRRAPEIAALVACGLFEPPEERRYAWSRTYTGTEWCDLLATTSAYRTHDPDRVAALLAGVRDAIDQVGGTVLVQMQTRLVTAVRRDPLMATS